MSKLRLYYRKTERAVIVLLCMIGGAGLFIPHMVERDQPKISYERLENLKKGFDDAERRRNAWKYVPIDINAISADSLINLGFPQRLSYRITKYRKKVGVFKNEEDLCKIYGLNDSILQHMQIVYSGIFSEEKPTKKHSKNGAEFDYSYRKENKKKTYVNTAYKQKKITIDSSRSKKPFGGNPKKTYLKTAKPLRIDINVATKEELMKIRGIGPVFSERILNYRDRLGGFYRIEQMKYIPKLHPDAYEAAAPYVYIETPPKKLDNLEAWSKHPYVSKKQFKKISKLKNEVSNDSLLLHRIEEEYIFSSREWDRLQPYLK